jgi:hypothetical protein
VTAEDHVAWSVVKLIQTLKGTSAGDILRDAVAAEFGLAPAEPRDPLANDRTLLVDIRRAMKSRTVNVFEVDGLMKRLKLALNIEG